MRLPRWALLSGLLLGAAGLAIAAFTASDQFAHASEAKSAAVRRHVPDNLFGVTFVDANNGWASGYYGTLLQTTDGGKTWVRRPIPATDLVRRIQFLDVNTGWLVTHRGRIMATRDGGKTWAVQYEDATTNLRAITMLNAATGWAVGHNATVLHTTDGGKTWIVQPLNYPSADAPRLNGVAAYDSMNAVLVGEFGMVARTSNGGQSWEVFKSASEVTYTAVAINADRAVAVGLNGAILEIPKTGAPIARDNASKAHLFDVAADKGGRVLAVGAGGAVEISPTALTPRPFDPKADENLIWLGGVTFLPGGSAVAVGMSGLIAGYDPANAKFQKSQDWTQ